MDLTTALTGMLPLIVLVSAILTAIVSAMRLRLYKRAVVRAMSTSSEAAPSPSHDDAPIAPSEPSPLTITKVGAGDPVSGADQVAYQVNSASL